MNIEVLAKIITLVGKYPEYSGWC